MTLGAGISGEGAMYMIPSTSDCTVCGETEHKHRNIEKNYVEDSEEKQRQEREGKDCRFSVLSICLYCVHHSKSIQQEHVLTC